MKVIKRRIAVVGHDLLMVNLAWLLAFLARFNFAIPAAQWDYFYQTLPIVLIIQGAVLWWTGLYRGLWRYASIPDLWNIIRAVAIGFFFTTILLFLYKT